MALSPSTEALEPNNNIKLQQVPSEAAEPYAIGAGAVDWDRPLGTQLATLDDVFRQAMALVADTQQVLQLAPTVCRVLLAHHKWNMCRLIEKYYDCGGDARREHQLLAAAGVLNEAQHAPWDKSAGTSDVLAPAASGSTCVVCCTSVDSQLSLRPCHDKCCKNCWIRHFQRCIEDGHAEKLHCVACDTIVDDDFVKFVFGDTSPNWHRFVRRLIDSFIVASAASDDVLVHWCVRPGCDAILRASTDNLFYFCCRAECNKCSKRFCLKCGHDNWHAPITCTMLADWIHRSSKESESQHWIVENTKPCPKCHIAIEKNGGCHHMRCQKCAYEFCWLCMSDWSVHGYNTKCATFSAPKNELDDLRAAVQRHLFYWRRYSEHGRSFDSELKLYDKVKLLQRKLLALEPNCTPADVRFMEEAVTILLRCRQTLVYTYPLAFFLRLYNKNNHQLEIFEHNQEHLADTVENLSSSLEHGYDPDVSVDHPVAKVRQSLVDRRCWITASKATK